VRGFLTVLLVSVSFDLLHLGDSGIGWLAAAIGIGGIAGGLYAVVLTVALLGFVADRLYQMLMQRMLIWRQ